MCRLRGLVRRLTAELQAQIDEMRPKTSVLKTPKRERAARKATERGVVQFGWRVQVCVAAEHRHTLEPKQWSLIVVQASRGRLTVRRREQLLGASVLAHARAFLDDQYTRLHAARPAEVREPSRASWTSEVHAL